MTELSWFALAIAIVAEVVAAVLVAMEAAITRISPVRASELEQENRKGARALAVVTADPARFITSVLFLRIGFSVLAVVIVADLVFGTFTSPMVGVALATVVMLIANFIFLGVAPRTLGQQHSVGLALRTAGLVKIVGMALYPITKSFVILGNSLTPGKGFSEGPFASEAEIRAMLDRAGAAQVIDSDEHRMLESVFELGDTMCRELMVPRTEMVFIERYKRLGQALSLSLRSGFSRIPVIGEDLDDVVGVIHLKDLVAQLNIDDEAKHLRVAELMRPAMLVPDVKQADDLLREFQATRTHLAVLIDEYGGTAGLVTTEDILEEIVGEINDEYDRHEIPECQQLGEQEWRVSARMSLSDLAEVIGLADEDVVDGVDTVAGLLAKQLGLVPIAGSQINYAGFTLIAESTEGRRNQISTIRVCRCDQECGNEESGAVTQTDGGTHIPTLGTSGASMATGDTRETPSALAAFVSAEPPVPTAASFQDQRSNSQEQK